MNFNLCAKIFLLGCVASAYASMPPVKITKENFNNSPLDKNLPSSGLSCWGFVEKQYKVLQNPESDITDLSQEEHEMLLQYLRNEIAREYNHDTPGSHARKLQNWMFRFNESLRENPQKCVHKYSYDFLNTVLQQLEYHGWEDAYNLHSRINKVAHQEWEDNQYLNELNKWPEDPKQRYKQIKEKPVLSCTQAEHVLAFKHLRQNAVAALSEVNDGSSHKSISKERAYVLLLINEFKSRVSSVATAANNAPDTWVKTYDDMFTRLVTTIDEYTYGTPHANGLKIELDKAIEHRDTPFLTKLTNNLPSLDSFNPSSSSSIERYNPSRKKKYRLTVRSTSTSEDE